MTNYEKIKNMSVGEMITLLTLSICECCAYKDVQCRYGMCNNGIKKWLESECDEE